MDSDIALRFWILYSSWAVAFFFAWVWGCKLISDQEILQAAAVVVGASETRRQLELLVRAINAGSDNDDDIREIMTKMNEWVKRRNGVNKNE